MVLIGPCVSGKSTVAAALRARGLDARSVAQEHTSLPHLYLHPGPDIVVYLDVSYEEAARRRSIAWGPERHQAQKAFMTAARVAADLVIPTDGLTVEAVVQQVQAFVRSRHPDII